MKSRKVIGIVCIVLALTVTFGVAPLVNKLADSCCEDVRMTEDVTQGHMTIESDIEVVTIIRKPSRSKDQIVLQVKTSYYR